MKDLATDLAQALIPIVVEIRALLEHCHDAMGPVLTEYRLRGMPLPVNHADFVFSQRDLALSRQARDALELYTADIQGYLSMPPINLSNESIRLLTPAQMMILNRPTTDEPAE
jgi:hypothetical protein